MARLAVLGLKLDGDFVASAHRAGELGAGEHLHALLAEALLDLKADLFVLNGEDAIDHLHEGDLGAVAQEHAGELGAHRARAQHHQVLGLLGHRQQVVRVDDALAVMLKERQVAARAARGHDGELGLQGLDAAVGCGDADLVAPSQATVAELDVDLVLLHQVGDALGVLVDHLGAVLVHALHVDLGGARLDHAEVLAVPHLRDEVCGVEHRLGRNTAAQQTRAAETLLSVDLHNGCLETLLSGVNRRHVATRATANHHNIVLTHNHSPCLLCRVTQASLEAQFKFSSGPGVTY